MKFVPFLLLSLPLLSQADEAFFRGDPKEVMLVCAEKARILAPRKSSILIKIGRAHLVAGDRVKAEEAFKAAYSTNSETRRMIGQAWLDCGFTAEALTEFKRLVIRTGTSGRNAMVAAATNLMDAGLTQPAEQLFEDTLLMAPLDWKGASVFARACLRQGRQDLAAKWYAEAIGKYRSEAKYWNEITVAFAEGGAERCEDCQ